jgi:hypothetical protein
VRAAGRAPVHAVEPALHALAAAGIPAVARNRAFRALLQFFGAYAPIELCVPPERAGEAAALCAQVVGGAAGGRAAPDQGEKKASSTR